MSSELMTRNNDLPTPGTWATMQEMAAVLLESGLLPKHIQKPAAAVAIMLKGRELGVPTMHALSNIVVIQGKPTANAELLLALIYRDHGDQALTWIEITDEVASCTFKRRGSTTSGRFAFTLDMARQAGLLDGPNKLTWSNYPGAMLRARCISAVARLSFPDSIGGMYLPEEMGAQVVIDHEGNVDVIETTATEAPMTAAQWQVVDEARQVAQAPQEDTGSTVDDEEENVRSVVQYARNAMTADQLRKAYKRSIKTSVLEHPDVDLALRQAWDRLVTAGVITPVGNPFDAEQAAQMSGQQALAT